MKKKRMTAHNYRPLEGMRFGRLLVVSRDPAKHDKPKWICVCDCGNKFTTSGCSLRRGSTKSCGCLCADRSRESNRRHGMKGSRAYQAWNGIKDRCYNKRSKDYARYGGRGITVCEQWIASFSSFYADMGDPPIGMSLDRTKNGEGYSKNNCCWRTPKQQARNRRGNVRVEIDGMSKTCSELDESYGFYPGTVARRASRGATGLDLVRPINPRLARCQTRSNSKTME